MSIQIPQDRYIKVGNVNTRYWQAGERGSFVLLIHGFPASVEAWEKNINVLARQHRVYALDWLGSGRTDKLPLVKDMFEVVDFIIKFMDTLHMDKASLIGNSMGGGIALAMVIQHPERVEKLVLVNAAGLGPEVATYFHLISIPWLGKLLTGKTTRESVQKMGEAIFYDPSTMTKEMVDLLWSKSAPRHATSGIIDRPE
jgi:pimeloyl-ACP methyl ester carboxylesterase